MHRAMSKLRLGGAGVRSELHLATIITAPDHGTGKYRRFGGFAIRR
jgi:hypothetical protein